MFVKLHYDHYFIVFSELPGVEVVASTSVIITRSAQFFKWPGHGLELHILANSLPPNVHTCVLQIYASCTGQYKFPDATELVSAVYWIKPVPYCAFSHPITLQLQHCVKKSNLKNLCFVRAVDTQETFPYNFTRLENRGFFSDESQYGCMEVEHFSGYGLVADEGVERLYTAGLYYLGQGLSSWHIHLTLHWDMDIHNTVSVGDENMFIETWMHI